MTIEKITEVCEKYSIKCKVFGSTVFLSTEVAEWYFDMSESPKIRLFHENYFCRSSYKNKFRNSFHMQKKSFKDAEELIRYVFLHDKNFYRTA